MMANKYINATSSTITLQPYEILMSPTDIALPVKVNTTPSTKTSMKKQKRVRPVLKGQNYLSLRGR